MNRSQMMTRYNELKRNSYGGNLPRLDRGFCIAQSENAQDVIAKWNTTDSDCQCPDHQYRMKHIPGGACKHMMASRMMNS